MIEVDEQEYASIKQKAELADTLAPKVDELTQKVIDLQVKNVGNDGGSQPNVDIFDEYCYKHYDKKGD